MRYLDKERRWTLRGAVLCILVIAIVSFSNPHMAQVRPEPLVIVSPVDGSVVEPGQTVVVNVSVAPGTSFTDVVIGIQDIGFGPLQIKSRPPFVFTVTIPNEVIGRKKITAFGLTSPGRGIFSQPVTIDIEPRSLLKTFTVSPAQIKFAFAGAQIPITVSGNFSDGSVLDVTNSSLTTYHSSDIRVATVSTTGLVTAIGLGATNAASIAVGYGSESVSVPVSVPRVVPFSSFSAKVEVKEDRPPRFEVNSAFTLGSDSNGINPANEYVTLQIGSSSITIPPSSFMRREKGGFEFEGNIMSLELAVNIEPGEDSNRSYKFKLEGKGLDVTGTNPVTIVLVIGDDGGTTTMRAEFDREKEHDR